jgi:hypothetical protein
MASDDWQVMRDAPRSGRVAGKVSASAIVRAVSCFRFGLKVARPQRENSCTGGWTRYRNGTEPVLAVRNESRPVLLAMRAE